MLERLYMDDPWMNFNLIRVESNCAGNLFAWSNKILDFLKINN